MSGPQFTPGPWVTRESHDLSGDIAIVAPAGIVAECFMAIRASNEVGSSEVHSNARLIAAAPELYEALQMLAGWLQDVNGSLTREDEAKVFAALAKARGEA